MLSLNNWPFLYFMRLILTSGVHLPRWEGWCLGSDQISIFCLKRPSVSFYLIPTSNVNTKTHEFYLHTNERRRNSTGRAKPSNMYLVGYESRGKICKWFFLDPSCYEASAEELSWWRCWVMLPDVMCVMKTLLHVTMDWNTLAPATSIRTPHNRNGPKDEL